MSHPRLFALLTILLVGCTATVIVVEKVYQGDYTYVWNHGWMPPVAPRPPEGAGPTGSNANGSNTEVVSEEPQPATSNELQEAIDSLPTVSSIPWQKADALKAFKDAAYRSCRLVRADLMVSTPIAAPTAAELLERAEAADQATPDATESDEDGEAETESTDSTETTDETTNSEPGSLSTDSTDMTEASAEEDVDDLPEPSARVLKGARMDAFTIGLRMDARGRSELSAISKSTIERYLNEHRLVIQPTVYNRLSKEPMFNGDVQSAFYDQTSPHLTMRPEPMVEEAISRLRVVGLFAEPGQQADPRTMILAFQYVAEDPTKFSNVLNTETSEVELIFLHLVPRSSGPPELLAFVTNGGRKQLMELDTKDLLDRGEAPSVKAYIRFKDFKFAGLYPADPIVTRIENRSRQSLPVTDFRRRLEKEGEGAISLGALLEELHSHPQSP